MRVLHLLRKPLTESSIVQNTCVHGVGGLNVDASRISSSSMPTPTKAPGWDAYNKRNAELGYRPVDYKQGDALYLSLIHI